MTGENTIIFTVAGRTAFRDQFLDKKQVLVCEQGFLDQTEGIPFSDMDAIAMVLQKVVDGKIKVDNLHNISVAP